MIERSWEQENQNGEFKEILSHSEDPSEFYSDEGALFYFDASEVEQIGNHHAIIEVKLEQVIIAPRLYIQILIEILDCHVDLFEAGEQAFTDSLVALNEQLVLPFTNYT